MGINRVTKRGHVRLEIRKRLPDGSTIRRYMPNRTAAKAELLKIELAILDGTWPELKRDTPQADLTVSEFAEIYLERYCRQFNRRPDFKEQALVSVTAILGDVPLKHVSRQHADQFALSRGKTVAPATVNRGLAVLRHMLTFATKRGYVPENPLRDLDMLPEAERALRIMTLREERALVMAAAGRSQVVGAYTALLGETGLRKSEGLRLRWDDIDWQRRLVSVTLSKTGSPRQVPLSDYAIAWLQQLTRWVKSPWVFTLASGSRLRSPRNTFERAKEAAGLEWVKGLHDLRHFRATQWLIHGVDLYSVKTYLGHKRIETTQRYLHFVPGHAEAAVRAAQQAEIAALGGRHMGDTVPSCQPSSLGDMR